MPLVGYILLSAITAYPFTRLLPRVGLSPWFALGVLIPFGLIVLLYVVAFKERV
ncbi:MAG: hypothetical protein AAGA87_04210 [Pseudomonadota bacterium]